ncbi:hypothetical protein [Lentzea sp.]|uniref:hypothetical protein n=1 Tax=Lentzea sp. TaxID=56099 RepID=UPI002BC5339B|nr:hypothetical protein [Lentzea sp.]HUQ54866.1 hypothetical protein [Lentzea sp.]
MSESFWVDIPNLRLAAAKLENEGNKIRDILSRLRDEGGSLTDPATFGVGDNAGDKFHPKWKGYVEDLVDGVRGWGDSVVATAEGVRVMADMFEKADDNAEARAAAIERAIGALDMPDAPPGFSGKASGGDSRSSINSSDAGGKR